MSFPLVGNENARSAVENAIISHRLPHALMIEGDEGQGRKTLAQYIAKAAVCEGEGLPCGNCRGCHLADVGSHPDISLISPEEGKKNISVAQIRALRAEAYVKAHSAEHRVFIITNAERMNEQAQNALLKVLEEPPQGVIFILIVPARTVMLETIISRCSVLSLNSPTEALAFDVLKNSIPKADDQSIYSALKKVGNNIGRAKAILTKKKESPARAAAQEFLQLLFSGSELDMLKAVLPFEKDRPAAEEFFSCLKQAIAAELRLRYDNPARAKVLTALYSKTLEYEQLLKTNINLSLLFSAAVCEAKALKDNI